MGKSRTKEWRKSLDDSENILLEDVRVYSASLNKNVLIISTGAISISLFFLDGNEAVNNVGYLVWAWGLFTLGVIFCCLEYLLVKIAIDKRIAVIHKIKAAGAFNKKMQRENKDASKYADWSEKISFASLVSMVVGIICLLLFSYNNINMADPRNSDKHNRQQEGQKVRGSEGDQWRVKGNDPSAIIGDIKPPIKQPKK